MTWTERYVALAAKYGVTPARDAYMVLAMEDGLTADEAAAEYNTQLEATKEAEAGT